MNALSPWASGAAKEIQDAEDGFLYERQTGTTLIRILLSENSLWIITDNEQGGRVAFRPVFAAAGTLDLMDNENDSYSCSFTLKSDTGIFKAQVNIIPLPEPVINYRVTLTPSVDLFVPFWPRDILIPGKNGHPENTAGTIHASQVGTRSGLIYFSQSRPKAGSVMYLQNLTALQDYCEETQTSCREVVGGQWPELGFALPAATEKPLKAGKEIVISDAFVIFGDLVPEKEPDLMKQYLNLLSVLYLQLPRPETECHDWPKILDDGLRDLVLSPGCWTQVDGKVYLNAYVSDYETPPEIMVQLAVLLPLVDYCEWSGKKVDVMDKIRENLPEFYNENLKTVMRWLPAKEEALKGEEEQKKPGVMDSWYLHHPLLNLSRLALKGDKEAEQLFLDSTAFAIKAAHHFNYEWPVFYKMDTFEVLKEETEPGKGGEKDVPGLYAHVMLQAYELTNDEKYLREAKKAAGKLDGLGFELFYQANNTSFSAGALLRLYKLTKEEKYLDLSYVCLANVMNNVQLWDCNYGHGKNFPSFFAVFPLNNAPYTAVYEEQEVFAAMHEYLRLAEDVDILPSVSLLLAEFIRNLVSRGAYYYTPMLPQEMLSEEVKVGEVERNLWIALEDLQDGWEKSGQVGQEVYGSGNAFGILPRHYIRLPEQNFMIFCDYPKGGVVISKNKLSFKILGSEKLKARIRVIPIGNKKVPSVQIKSSVDGLLEPFGKAANKEYEVSGNQKITITW